MFEKRLSRAANEPLCEKGEALLKSVLSAVLMLTSLAAAPAGRAPAEPPLARAWSHDAAMTGAVRDLCNKDVALLGESAGHGDGRTLAFKAALVQRLVDACGFDAVFFEASHYDFLAFSKKLRTGQPASEAMLSSAIGGVWNRDREFAPVVPFLLAKARSGRLVLGGLDDQLGSAGAFYSLYAMPAELTEALPPERRAGCREALRRRIYYDYPRDKPYAAGERTNLQTCLAEMTQAAKAQPAETEPAEASTRAERLQMLASIDRLIARDLTDDPNQLRERGRSMHANFRWLAGRLPRRAKIIVWGATVHMAKDAVGTRSFGVESLSSHVHRAYGKRAFALGFSAYSGTYRWNGPEDRQLVTAPAGSLEARALAGSTADSAYLGPARLAKLGTLTGAAFNHQFEELNWGAALDGIVVFREERPPSRVR